MKGRKGQKKEHPIKPGTSRTHPCIPRMQQSHKLLSSLDPCALPVCRPNQQPAIKGGTTTTKQTHARHTHIEQKRKGIGRAGSIQGAIIGKSKYYTLRHGRTQHMLQLQLSLYHRKYKHSIQHPVFAFSACMPACLSKINM